MVEFETKQRRLALLPITQEVIDKVPCTRMFTMDSKVNTFIQARHKDLLSYAMRHNKSREVGILIDMTDWSWVRLEGSETGISFQDYPDVLRKIKTARFRSLIFLHNHPNNSCFSEVDLDTFGQFDSFFMMTAITHTGNVHVLQKTGSYCHQVAMYELNRFVNINQGVSHVLHVGRRLGLLYKFGRCAK